MRGANGETVEDRVPGTGGRGWGTVIGGAVGVRVEGEALSERKELEEL